jgi:hypothetical protein
MLYRNTVLQLFTVDTLPFSLKESYLLVTYIVLVWQLTLQLACEGYVTYPAYFQLGSCSQLHRLGDESNLAGGDCNRMWIPSYTPCAVCTYFVLQ